MPSLKDCRNISIVLALAAAIDFLPGGRRAGVTAEALFTALFAAGLGFFAYRMYREQRISIHGLGDRHRALLYGALVLAAFLIVAYSRMLHSTALVGVLWFALLGVLVYMLVVVYRAWRSYA
jgi:hypothetical protein